MIKQAIYPILFAGVLFAPVVFAHKNHAHPPASQEGDAQKKEQAAPMHVEKVEDAAFKRINEGYVAKVKPIFQRKCMDCHGGKTEYPWYHKIPGIKQMIEADIAEAREHLDFSPGFPFKSHATPKEDLDAIAETTQDRSMPPFRYRLMHSSTALTDEERRAILDWVEASKKELSRSTSP